MTPTAELRTILRLVLDASTAEVVCALRDRGIRSILLKGPTIAGWLYDDPSDRDYGDIDLLVAPRDFPRAERVLAELGFDCRWPAMRPFEAPDHERLWTRPSALPVDVDLHRSIYGPSVDPTAVWDALADDLPTMDVGRKPVDVLGPPARSLMLALHAAQHGAGAHKPLRDLELGVARIDEATWRAAAALADRLAADEPFAAGLRLVPAGRRLADRLGLTRTASVFVSLHAAGSPPTAIGFAQLHAQPNARARAGFVVSKLFPSPTLLRYRLPVARRGPGGLVLAYAYRLLWLVTMAPRGWAAWRRAADASSG